jgi:hypothetical protein
LQYLISLFGKITFKSVLNASISTRSAATRNAVMAFELRAVELVRHTISGPARQAWMAT